MIYRNYPQIFGRQLLLKKIFEPWHPTQMKTKYKTAATLPKTKHIKIEKEINEETTTFMAESRFINAIGIK